MIRNIMCSSGCGAKLGSYSNAFRSQEQSYMCAPCSRKVEVFHLLKNKPSLQSDQLKDFAERHDGKPMTRESWQELFSLLKV